MESFDIVVIGAGPGGYPAAIRAAQLGASVAIVEKEQLGGTCLNWGCIPTKALIGGADIFARARDAKSIGITATSLDVDYGAMTRHKDRVVEKLRGGIKQLLDANGVKSFVGAASFKNPHAISVGDATIGAKTFVIATGSTSVMPGFLPKHEKIVESRAFLDLRQLPDTLIVLGGGIIGCELACLAATLGVKVTIVELCDDILMLLDSDIRRAVRSHMEKKLGIRILCGNGFEKITVDGNVLKGIAGGETVSADMLLCAIGRRPVTEGLNLPAVGIEPSERGYIPTDDHGRTKTANIFAIGDVTGRIQLAHYATSQGIVVAENACGQKLRRIETLVPNVIFTTPEVGSVGLNEADAKKLGLAVRTGQFQFRQLGRAIAMEQTEGFVKWIADPATGQLLGAAAVGAHATELIAEAAVAVRAELTVQEFGRTIHAHPTFGEAWMEAAHAVHGHAIHSPPRKGSSD